MKKTFSLLALALLCLAAGAQTITQSAGWLESAYVEWSPVQGADSYNVYYTGGGKTNQQIDEPLIRSYGAYLRADVLGLKAGDYTLTVKPVVGGVEQSGATTGTLTVKAHDRSGFAHFNYKGVGAYNDDGTLKSGANLIYVSAKTAKTVECTVNGTKLVGLQTILDAYQKKGTKPALCVRVIGKVEKADLDKISSSAQGLQIKGNSAYSEMNITFEGVGKDATIRGFGFLVRNCKSIEMRNFGMMLFMDDGFSFDTDNSNCWVHHVDLFYGGTGGDADQAKGDGSLDLKGDSKYMTFSYVRFWDAGKASLCGMTSESGENFITYHHNWFDHSDSRHPRVRTMTVHVYNNYYDGVAKYGAGATTGSNVFVENNYFRNTNKPMLISLQGSDISSDPDGKGTFSGETGGMIKSFGNVYAEKSGNFKLVTHKQHATEFDCYEADARNEQVPSTYKTLRGGNIYNNFDTDPAKMYAYTPDAAADIPTIIQGEYGAGRMQHGDFTWTYNNAVDDASYAVNTQMKSAISSYTSSLKAIQGDKIIIDTTPPPCDTCEITPPDTTKTTTSGGICDIKAQGSASGFSITGNTATDKGDCTYNGNTYTCCLKMESSTNISFSVVGTQTLTLVFGGTKNPPAGLTVKIDETAHTIPANGVVSVELAAGSHFVTKGKTVNLYYIALSGGSTIKDTTCTTCDSVFPPPPPPDTMVVDKELSPAKVWDFREWSEESLQNLAEDGSNWRDSSRISRYINNTTIAAGATVTASDVAIAELEGLQFSALAADKLRIDYSTDTVGTSRIILNGKDLDMTVPSCKKDDTIRVTFRSSNATTARGFSSVTNVTGDNAQTSNAIITNTYLVSADGNATFRTSSGLQIFRITLNERVVGKVTCDTCEITPPPPPPCDTCNNEEPPVVCDTCGTEEPPVVCDTCTAPEPPPVECDTCTEEPPVVCDTCTEEPPVVSAAAKNTLKLASLYPNPVGSELFIDNGGEYTRAEVVSLNGSVVQTLSLTTGLNVYNLSALHSGVYFVKLSGKGGAETHRIVKE